MSIPNIHIDPVIISKIATGDQAAFKIFYDNYYLHIFHMAWNIGRSKASAEDLVQEVFIRLWTQRHQLVEIEQLSAFISKITSNLIYNKLRREAVEDSYIFELIKNEGLITTSEAAFDMQFKDLQNHIQTAIDQLSPQQKRVFLLSRSEGLRYEDIAHQLGISASTVKFHIIEALKSLKTYLKAHDVLVSYLIWTLISHFY